MPGARGDTEGCRSCSPELQPRALPNRQEPERHRRRGRGRADLGEQHDLPVPRRRTAATAVPSTPRRCSTRQCTAGANQEPGDRQRVKRREGECDRNCQTAEGEICGQGSVGRGRKPQRRRHEHGRGRQACQTGGKNNSAHHAEVSRTGRTDRRRHRLRDDDLGSARLLVAIFSWCRDIAQASRKLDDGDFLSRRPAAPDLNWYLPSWLEWAPRRRHDRARADH